MLFSVRALASASPGNPIGRPIASLWPSSCPREIIQKIIQRGQSPVVPHGDAHQLCECVFSVIVRLIYRLESRARARARHCRVKQLCENAGAKSAR